MFFPNNIIPIFIAFHLNQTSNLTPDLIAYLKDSVSQDAFTQNRQQDPMLAGDPDKVLMSY